MHLNINSLHSKINEIDKILKLEKFDIVALNETKLDKNKPTSFYQNSDYDIIRRDRDFDENYASKRGGGIMVFVKKHYKAKFIKAPDDEIVCIKITIGKQLIQFISAYKSPKHNAYQFITALEKFISGLDLNEPIFIVGDLNLDILQNYTNGYVTEKGLLLREFMDNYNLKCPILYPTRVADYHNKISGITRTSRSLIDVILHNQDLIDEIIMLDCPFSDHKMLLSSIKKSPRRQNMWLQ
jgi:hypothetical protein